MVSIVVINFKNPPLLRLCLKSLRDNISAAFKYEIIVIDSQSSVETRNIIDEFSGVRIIPFKNNIGYTRGVNEGLRASLGSQVLILNPDIIPVAGSVERISEYLDNNPKVGLVGPRLLNFDGTPQASCFRFYSAWTMICRRTILGSFGIGKKAVDRFLMKDIDLEKTAEVDWLMGSALLVSKEAVDKVGMMDQNLFLYMTDVDWAQRFWENGYRVVYYPASRMYHYHKRSSKGRFILADIFLKKETRWHITDAIKYFRKYGLSAKSHAA